MPSRRYASGTTVDVGKTKGEMIGLLETYGASHYGFGKEPGGDVLMFKLGRLSYKMVIPEPDIAAMRQAYIDDQKKRNTFYEDTIKRRAAEMDWAAKVDAEKRRLWRLRLIWLKATLEFATEQGGETAQALLLPFMMLPSGQQVKEWAADAVEQLEQGKAMPLLLGA